MRVGEGPSNSEARLGNHFMSVSCMQGLVNGCRMYRALVCWCTMYSALVYNYRALDALVYWCRVYSGLLACRFPHENQEEEDDLPPGHHSEGRTIPNGFEMSIII